MRPAEASDVVVEAFRPGVADRLGIGYRQMAKCLLASIPNNLGSAIAARRKPDLRRGRSLGCNALYVIYDTKDGEWIALGGQEMKFAANLLTMLGRPDLIELCAQPPGPGQEPVRDFLRATFLTRTKREWIDYFAGHDVPFAPVQDLPECLQDKHFRMRGAGTISGRR